MHGGQAFKQVRGEGALHDALFAVPWLSRVDRQRHAPCSMRRGDEGLCLNVKRMHSLTGR